MTSRSSSRSRSSDSLDEGVAALDRTDGTERRRTDRSMDDLALADGTLYGTAGETLLALQ